MYDVFSDDRNAGANRACFVQLSQGTGGRTRTRTTYYSICQAELNETKCNQMEPVCPETFPGCVGNSSSSSDDEPRDVEYPDNYDLE